jgi:uncharacterized membrane protein
MARHVKILGILHIVFGAMGVFAAVVVLLIFGGISALVSVSDRSTDLPAPILGVIGSVIFIIVLVLSLPGLIIGIGLMQFRPWARIGGIVMSALDLLGFPFHTALAGW